MPAKDKFAVKIIRTINLIQFCIQCESLSERSVYKRDLELL